MNNLINETELSNISGGAIHWAVIGFAIGAFAFIAGVVDGYLRPYGCRK